MTVDPTSLARRARRTTHPVRNVAVAAVAAISIAACSDDDEKTAAPSPEPTTSTTSAAAEPTTTTDDSSRVPGHIGPVPITFALLDGWDDIGWGAIKGDPIYGLIFMQAGNTFADPCQSVAVDPVPGPTADDLAAAFAAVPNLNATVTDITMDGYDGKLVEFTVPEYVEDECVNEHFILLEGEGTPGDGYWAQGPSQHTQLRIVDVDGERVVIGTGWFDDTSEAERADIEAMANSIQFG